MNTEWIRMALLSLLLCMVACKPPGEGTEQGEGKKAESKHLVVVTEANFDQQVMKSDKLVMVDYWASWCAPCRAIAPAVSDLADAYSGQVKVGKLSVENDGKFAQSQKVENLPTIRFYKGGKQVDEVVGLVSRDVLEEKIKKHL